MILALWRDEVSEPEIRVGRLVQVGDGQRRGPSHLAAGAGFEPARGCPLHR
jgi:hypothetical protein